MILIVEGLLSLSNRYKDEIGNYYKSMHLLTIEQNGDDESTAKPFDNHMRINVRRRGARHR